MIGKDVVATELLGFSIGYLLLHLTVSLTFNGVGKLTLPRHPSN